MSEDLHTFHADLTVESMKAARKAAEAAGGGTVRSLGRDEEISPPRKGGER